MTLRFAEEMDSTLDSTPPKGGVVTGRHHDRACLVQTTLGRLVTLEALECTLELLEVGGTLVEFRAVNLGALVQTGILNGSGCRNGKQLGQS
jgi:hypothetical protein